MICDGKSDYCIYNIKYRILCVKYRKKFFNITEKFGGNYEINQITSYSFAFKSKKDLDNLH